MMIAKLVQELSLCVSASGKCCVVRIIHCHPPCCFVTSGISHLHRSVNSAKNKSLSAHSEQCEFFCEHFEECSSPLFGPIRVLREVRDLSSSEHSVKCETCLLISLLTPWGENNCWSFQRKAVRSRVRHIWWPVSIVCLLSSTTFFASPWPVGESGTSNPCWLVYLVQSWRLRSDKQHPDLVKTFIQIDHSILKHYIEPNALIVPQKQTMKYFKPTKKAARRKLEVPKPAAMPCKNTKKEQWRDPPKYCETQDKIFL